MLCCGSTEGRRRPAACRLAWLLVAYTVVIIAWGAWVRLSHSGDGCGDHWPLCNGRAIPLDAPAKTWVEVSHRYSTALYGVLVVALIWISRKRFPASHPARFWPAATLVFTLSEALIGRQLVTMRLVDQSTDLARLIIMPLHLINTSALLFCCVMAAESFAFGDAPRLPLPRPVRRAAGFGALALVGVLATGALAALGSHLAPAASLAEGLASDLSQDSHLAVRLRLLHPVIGLSLALFAPPFLARLITLAPTPAAQAWCRLLRIAVFVAIGGGVLTLISLAPAGLTLTHLTLANMLIVIASAAFFHMTRNTSKSQTVSNSSNY